MGGAVPKRWGSVCCMLYAVPPIPKWFPPGNYFGQLIKKEGKGRIWVRAGGGRGGARVRPLNHLFVRGFHRAHVLA